MSSFIFLEDEQLETVFETIIKTTEEKALILDHWQTIHERTFGPTHDIPFSEEMSLTKMKDNVVNSDTRNGARLTSAMLVDTIDNVLKEKAKDTGDKSDHKVLCMDCHHHLYNVWIGALNKYLSKYLSKFLQEDLNAIDFRYRVSTMLNYVHRVVDKELSLSVNYPKGCGD